jgi:hypothetical protein
MRTKTLFASTIALTLIGSTIVPQIAKASPALTEESRLGTNGIGPVHAGMSIEEAESASGRRFIVRENPLGGSCTYATARGLDGVSFMLIKGIIERVDISNRRIMTLRGAKIGDSEKSVNSLYPGQIKTTRHPYQARSGGHYLTFFPRDKEDQDYRLIFETSNGKVNAFRGGRLPAVDYIEGCS